MRTLRSHITSWTTSLPMPFSSLSSSIPFLLIMASNYAYALDSSQMGQHLSAGAPLLGTFSQSSDQIANWMSGFGDNTTIESLSIPGTHDSLTCGFSQGARWSFLMCALVGNVTGELALVYQTQVRLPTLENNHALTDQIRIFLCSANSTEASVSSTCASIMTTLRYV